VEVGGTVALLPGIAGPADVQRLDPEQLPVLAAEIRDLLVSSVSRTGGHLGPNLGAVELTLALHRVFTSPRDRILFDTGHQTYVHKMLTGRADRFDTLRKEGGLSGYPSAEESEHDVIENSHASTALSYADGLVKAYRLRGEKRPVIAVVGDGALTGGMCWEALNNIAASDRQVIVVVNDNGRSYAPTIGGLAAHLAHLRLNPQYEYVLDVVRSALSRTPLVGAPLYEALHGIKRGLKDLVQPQVMFEDLGLKYVGPVDGHDEPALEQALRSARDFGGPVIVHCVTRKGYGYRPAEDDEADRFHGVGVIDPLTGKPLTVPTARTWTSAFGDEMVALGRERPDVVAITAAMLEPVGLGAFAAAFPERVFDVGIAEQHAVTSATGLAMGGMRPVVCLYATFLNRAFDQVLLDVALHRQPVVFVLDRAGVTGDDGPSHNGMWDLSWLPMVPGLVAHTPRDEPALRAALRASLDRTDGPSVVRFPKGALPSEISAVARLGSSDVDVLRRPASTGGSTGDSGDRPDVLLVAYGAMAGTALEVAERAADQGIGVTVVDPGRVCPVDPALVEAAARAGLVVTLEDNGLAGGAGSTLAAAMRAAEVDVPLRTFGLPQEFLPQGKRDAILTRHGLSAQAIARRIVEAVAQRDPELQPAPDV
jgi:1-deoxy-D-xylulose-5-phosphate synthase